MSRLLTVGLLIAATAAKDVTVSNVALPEDQNGNLLLTGEATVLVKDGTYYFYFNNWGGCPGVDCCPTSGGCGGCCFTGPPFTDPCVYTANHTVLSYSTTDFTKWTYNGVALSLDARRAGTEFRPQVVYNPTSKLYIMWYEDRWTSGTNRGYAVATSSTPSGPFSTIVNSTKVNGPGRVGDYDVFVDTDGTAYHIRTGVVVEQLDAMWTATTGQYYSFLNGNVEGPSMFKRNGVYYLLLGVGCCACRGGSNIEVYTATAALGPYVYRGDVGSNTTQKHDIHSPYNYVTKSQGSKVFEVPAADGSTQYVFLGNQWVTASQPGNPRNHDLLYWSVLKFDTTGNITQLEWQDTTTISMP